MDTNLYTPMNTLILDKETKWTFTTVNLTYAEIAVKGLVLWCVDNLEGRWTMLGGNKFGFEHGADATMFRIQFGF